MSNDPNIQLPSDSAADQGFANADAIPQVSTIQSDSTSPGQELMDKDSTPLEGDRAEGEALVGAALAQQEDISPSAQKAAPWPKPSIMYAVPANLLDITSGAALSQRSLMSALARKGFRAIALEATIFDSAQGGEHLLKAAEAQKDKTILRSMVDGVQHWIVRTGHVRRHMMTSEEVERYLMLFREFIRKARPDMIFMWGGMLLEMTIMREAREAGIPVVFYLVNGSYKNKETFQYVSTIVTDTQATAQLYKERHGLECHVVGKFIEPARVKPQVQRRPDFITFINPSFEKGVSVFMALAKLAAVEAPEVKFLVVQSRGRWATAANHFKYTAADFPNVKIIGHQRDMRPVYASTRALVLPSLWHESGARVIAEAQINGIPVLASNTGGSAELVGAGGTIFDIPEYWQTHRTERVTADVVRPWLEEIKRVWHDAAYYDTLCERVLAEARQHDIDHNADRFIDVVKPLVLAARGQAPAQSAAPVSAAATRKTDQIRAALDRKNARLKVRQAQRKGR